MLLGMSSPATTRRARIAALALAAVMVLTLLGSALLGSTGTTTPAQAPQTTTSEQVIDLTDLTEEELATLLAQSEEPAEAPAPTP
jgi:nitrous oxide reductase